MNYKRPGFITIVIATIVILIGFALAQSGYSSYVMYAGMGLAGIGWIAGIIDVLNTPDLSGHQKLLWNIVVISVPVVGALLFYIMHISKGKIVS